MKKNFMIELFLPDRLTQEFIAAIPFHRTFIEELIEQGLVSTYSVNLKRNQAWIMMLASSNREAESIVVKSPIAPYIQFSVHELFINDSDYQRLPRLMLN